MSQVVVNAITSAQQSGRETTCVTPGKAEQDSPNWEDHLAEESLHGADKPQQVQPVAKATSSLGNIESAEAERNVVSVGNGSSSDGPKDELNSFLDGHAFNNNNHLHLDYLTNANKELLGNFLLPYQQLFPASSGLATSCGTVPWLTGKVPSTLPKNTCPYCGAVKGGPADLQRHIRKHTGERPFVCKVHGCGKAFKAKRSLQYHQFMNHGIETHNSNIGEKYLEARRRRVLSDHVRGGGSGGSGVEASPALSTAVQALFMLGNMSTGSGGQDLEVPGGLPGSSGGGGGGGAPGGTSAAGPPPPSKLTSAAVTSSPMQLQTGEAGSVHASTYSLAAAPPDGKAVDHSQDSLNNNSLMEHSTNTHSPPIALSEHMGVVLPTSTTTEMSVVDKNANYGAIKANNNNNNTVQAGASLQHYADKLSAHMEEYSLPTHRYQTELDFDKDHAHHHHQHHHHDGKRRSTSSLHDDAQDAGGGAGAPPPPKVLRTAAGAGNTDCNGESEPKRPDSAETDPEFRCPDCNLIYQKLEWLEGHKSTHGGEQPYRCQVCAKGFRVKGRLLCHEKDVHDIGVRQVFTSDDHYNLRARARPVDYSLTRRSFDIEFDEEFPSFAPRSEVQSAAAAKRPEPGEGELEARGDLRGSAGEADAPDPEPKDEEPRFSWGGERVVSSSAGSSSHIKMDATEQRVSIKAVSDSLHPAFHKHLMSQVHHHSGRSSTEAHPYPTPGDGVHHQGAYPDPHPDHDHDAKVKDARGGGGGSFDSHADPSPTHSAPSGGALGGMDYSVRSRNLSNLSDGSQSLLSRVTPSASSFEEGEIDTSTTIVEFPSAFPGLKDRISVKNETILVTKLNGVNVKTGSTVALYKCYMCNKMYNKMARLQVHMSVHFEHSVSVYTCEACGVNFKFRLQLLRHASRVHGSKPYAPPPLRRQRWASQSSSVPQPKASTITSPEDYKTRSPLVTSPQSPPGHVAPPPEERDADRDAANLTHLARSMDDHAMPSQEAEEEEEGEMLRREQLSPAEDEAGDAGESGDAEPGADGVPYPVGGIGSSLASSHPGLYKYLYRRHRGNYVCRYCNKIFFRLFSLQKHEQVHMGLKACFCKECGKGFSDPRNLRHHVMRYHGVGAGVGVEDAAMLQSVRRLRRPIISGLPRTSQRLAPVTPDMIEAAERLEKQGGGGGGGAQRLSPTPPSAYDFSKLSSPTSATFAQNMLERSRSYSAGSEPHGAPSASTSPSGSVAATATAAAATSQLNVDTTSPVSSHPSAAPGRDGGGGSPAPSPRHHHHHHRPRGDEAREPPPQRTTPQPSPSGHLASQIRQKEKLSEDVVVIIPSDAPLDGSEPAVATPRSSTASDTPWWNEPGGYMDTDSNQSGEVIHPAPRRSMMMDYKSQVKAANRERRKGQPVRIPSPSDDQEVAHLPPQEQYSPAVTDRSDRESVIREKLPSPRFPSPPRSAPPPDSSPPPPHVTVATPTSPPTLASMASPGLMFPGDLSSTTSPLGGAGLPPGAPPLYLGGILHPGLLSPSTLPLLRGAAGPAALLHGAAPPGLNPMRLGVPSPTAWAAAIAENFASSAGGGLGGGDPRMPTPYSKSSSSAGRNSSLRPRLNVVKIPVRREDACKPTLLPDGRTVYRCTYCSKDFGSFSDINRHMDFHEDIRPYKCKFCDYYARTNSQLKVHMMRHQGIREFLCKLCNYKGVTQSDLNRHMKSQIHMMKMQNECRLCGEGFVSPKNLEKHLAMCKGPKSDDPGLKRDWKSDDPPLKREWSH